MWHREGTYDAIAERLFNELPHDRFLLEYDTPRAGSFEPLRFVPKGKVVVLGLVSTKVPEMETVDGLKRRIDEAAKFIPLDQLAISPQCGFASDVVGNLHQRRRSEAQARTGGRRPRGRFGDSCWIAILSLLFYFFRTFSLNSGQIPEQTCHNSRLETRFRQGRNAMAEARRSSDRAFQRSQVEDAYVVPAVRGCC